jgi:hypothetical protein
VKEFDVLYCARLLGWCGSASGMANTKELWRYIREARRCPVGRIVVRRFGLIRRRYYSVRKRRQAEPVGRYGRYNRFIKRTIGELSTDEAEKWARRRLSGGFVLAFDHARDTERYGPRIYPFRIWTTNPRSEGGWHAELVAGGRYELEGARRERADRHIQTIAPFRLIGSLESLNMLTLCPVTSYNYHWGLVIPVPAPDRSPLVLLLKRVLEPRISRDLVAIVVDYALADALLSYCTWLSWQSEFAN